MNTPAQTQSSVVPSSVFTEAELREMEIPYEERCRLEREKVQQELNELLSRTDYIVPEDRNVREVVERNMTIIRQQTGLQERMSTDSRADGFLSSHHFYRALTTMYALEIGDPEVFLAVLDEMEKHRKNHKAGILDEGLLQICIEHLGKENIYQRFTNLQDKEASKKRKEILSFCMINGFSTGKKSPLDAIISSRSLSLAVPSDKKKPQHARPEEVYYIGAYASELNYMIQTLGVPFAVLYTLPRKTLGRHCGLIRSLGNCVYRLQGSQKYVEFLTTTTPSDVPPEELFSLETVASLVIEDTGELDYITLQNVNALGKFLRSYLVETGLHRHLLAQKKDLLTQITTVKNARAEKVRMRELEKKQKERKKQRDGRNYKTIASLASTFDHASIAALMGPAYASELISETTVSNKTLFLRYYAENIQRLSRQYAGLYSIGGKIHFPTAIPEQKIDAFRSKHNLDQTSFALIHANTSLILPPTNIPEELQFMIACMSHHGLIDNDPQLQISIPGRLPNHLAAILGSSMLLLSEQAVEYTPASFETTHNSHTGRRLVVYDAGVYDKNFQWNSDKIQGRTDVLLLKDLKLITKAKIVGSLLSQTEYDGWFAQLGMDFIADYVALLKKHNLTEILHHQRVYDDTTKPMSDEDALAHFQTVKKVTDKHFADRCMHNVQGETKGLLVFELRKLLTSYREKIQSIQQRFIG